MAFEAKVSTVLLIWLLKVDIYDTTSTLNASDCVTFAVGKAADRAGGVFEGAFSDSDGLILIVTNRVQVPDVDELFRV